MKTITVGTELTVVNCGECGGTYGINERYRKNKQESGGHWNCPYCRCSWGYSKGENAELREQIREQVRLLAAERARHDQTRASLRETENLAIKAKRRAAAGVCPCCKRTVKQMAQHMAEKHPQFVQEAGVALQNTLRPRLAHKKPKDVPAMDRSDEAG